MAEKESEVQSVLKRFRTLKSEAGIDDLPAAILVLADSIERAGTRTGQYDRPGHSLVQNDVRSRSFTKPETPEIKVALDAANPIDTAENRASGS